MKKNEDINPSELGMALVIGFLLAFATLLIFCF